MAAVQRFSPSYWKKVATPRASVRRVRSLREL
jgi:hypothetical protein